MHSLFIRPAQLFFISQTPLWSYTPSLFPSTTPSLFEKIIPRIPSTRTKNYTLLTNSTNPCLHTTSSSFTCIHSFGSTLPTRYTLPSSSTKPYFRTSSSYICTSFGLDPHSFIWPTVSTKYCFHKSLPHTNFSSTLYKPLFHTTSTEPLYLPHLVLRIIMPDI